MRWAECVCASTCFASPSITLLVVSFVQGWLICYGRVAASNDRLKYLQTLQKKGPSKPIAGLAPLAEDDPKLGADWSVIPSVEQVAECIRPLCIRSSRPDTCQLSCASWEWEEADNMCNNMCDDMCRVTTTPGGRRLRRGAYPKAILPPKRLILRRSCICTHRMRVLSTHKPGRWATPK